MTRTEDVAGGGGSPTNSNNHHGSSLIQSDAEVFVVGLAMRLPGEIRTQTSFFSVLKERKVVVSFSSSLIAFYTSSMQVLLSTTPADRWDAAKWTTSKPPQTGYSSQSRGGFLKSVYDFDASFFHMSPREAAACDPQQRIALELAYEAVREARLYPQQLSGPDHRTGVFVGAGAVEHLAMQVSKQLCEVCFS